MQGVLEKDFLPINVLKQIGNVELSALILGDSAYSLENWLIKPYSDRGNLGPDKARFNLHLAEVGLLLKMHLVV